MATNDLQSQLDRIQVARDAMQASFATKGIAASSNIENYAGYIDSIEGGDLPMFATVEQLQNEGIKTEGQRALVYDDDNDYFGGYYEYALKTDPTLKGVVSAASTYDNIVRATIDPTNVINAMKGHGTIFSSYTIAYDASENVYIAFPVNYNNTLFIASDGKKYFAASAPADEDYLYGHFSIDGTTFERTDLGAKVPSALPKIADSALYSMPAYSVLELEDNDIMFQLRGESVEWLTIYDEATAQNKNVGPEDITVGRYWPMPSQLNAMSNQILEGTTAYTNDGLVVGTMKNLGDPFMKPTNTSISIGPGYINKLTVQYIMNLSAQNIKSGVTIGNVPGTFTADGNITANEMALGKIAYANGQKIVGTLDIGALGGQFIAPSKLSFSGANTDTIIDISTVDISKVTNMSSMFSGTTQLQSIVWPNGFNAYKIKDMGYMFSSSGVSELNLAGWNTSGLTNNSVYGMFYNCRNLRNLDLSTFNLYKANTTVDMFNMCLNLTELNVSDINISNINNLSYMFSSTTNLTSLNTANWVLQRAYMTKGMFEKSGITTVDLNMPSTALQDTQAMFRNCANLTAVNGINSWNLNKVTTVAGMFTNCKSLEVMDLSGWATKGMVKLNNISSMFTDCPKLQNVNLSGWYSYNLVNATKAFMNCSNLVTINMDGMNLKKVANMMSMFTGCTNLSDESLNSIMGALTTATTTSNKKFANLGFTADQIATMATLSNYANANALGWS